jgi:hypothetical protein
VEGRKEVEERSMCVLVRTDQKKEEGRNKRERNMGMRENRKEKQKEKNRKIKTCC